MNFSLYERFTRKEAEAILSLDSANYHYAVSQGMLSASASLREHISCAEPFHLGWDLLRYKLQISAVSLTGLNLLEDELEDLLDDLETFLERPDENFTQIGTEWCFAVAEELEDPKRQLTGRRYPSSEYVPEPLVGFGIFLSSCVDLCCRMISEAQCCRNDNTSRMEMNRAGFAGS
jgi:hypothetical protein